jgi:hypothetical protein
LKSIILFFTPNIQVDFKIGDHVKPIKSSSIYKNEVNEIYTNEIYTIIRIYNNDNRTIDLISSKNPIDICDVLDKNNRLNKTWFLKRFEPAEADFQANKFNL